MCKSKLATLATTPTPQPQRSTPRSRSNSTAFATTSTTSSSSAAAATSTSSASSSHASLAAARAALPEAPILYPFPELAAATNNFLSKRSTLSSYWACTLRGRDAALYQLTNSSSTSASDVPAALSRVGKSHHTSLCRLLGAALAGGQLYLAYELPPGGATLAACLRNPRNPSFTPLSTWMSRVQVAADVAQGLEYIHHHASTIHGHVTSSTVLISDPDLRAKISLFGATDLAGNSGVTEQNSPYTLSGEPISHKSDVFAFGVLLLELISGDEPVRHRFDRSTKQFVRVSVVETAAMAAAAREEVDNEERKGRVRRWVDRRLRDSFPIAAAERMLGIGLRCTDSEASARPEMTWVAGRVSKVYLESKVWEERIKVPTEFSVTVGPR